MTALEYLTVRKEICLSNEKNGLIYCETCAFNCNCDFLEINYPDKAIEVVKKYIETKEKEKGNKK